MQARGSNLCLVPVYHARVNFARSLRAKFFEFDPDIVAVELPDDLEELVVTAVKRLPVLSIVGYVDKENGPRATIVEPPEGAADRDTGDQEGEPSLPGYSVVLNPSLTFVPVHPGDPMIEAIRLATEREKQIKFIDLNTEGYEPKEYALPDDECIDLFPGQDEFNELVSAHLPKSDPSSIDYDREVCMSSRLQDLLADGSRVLAVVGFAHYERIREFVEAGKRADVVDPNEHEGRSIFNVDPISSDLIIDEIPYMEYMFELSRRFPPGPANEPEMVAEISRNKFEFFKLGEKTLAERLEEDRALQQEGGVGAPPVVVRHGEDRWLQMLERTTAMEFEAISRKPVFTRRDALLLLVHVTNTVYQDYYFREPVSLDKLKAFMQYIRNWAILREKLFPTLDQVAIAAKSFVNDEYASILLDFARMYPFIDEERKYPAVFHDKDSNIVGPNNIFLRNRLSRRKKSWITLPIKRRPKEQFPGQWRDQWNNLSLCSYPPEDKVEEDYFNLLRQKTLSILEEKMVRVHEFRSSLLDGIEFRETMRKKILGKLFVKEIIPVTGKAGSVVIIFDPDEQDRFQNKITWWAEHAQESDMAFYATYPEQNLIGPGIARIQLGGLVSIFPPKHVPDIWRYFVLEAREFKKPEILLLAAIQFSEEKFIPFVSKDPPTRRLEEIAAEHDKIIITIPPWRLSGETFERIRFLHILKDRATRNVARNYIFL